MKWDVKFMFFYKHFITQALPIFYRRRNEAQAFGRLPVPTGYLIVNFGFGIQCRLVKVVTLSLSKGIL